MENIITQINALDYAVHLRQYNALTHAGEARWEACGTHRKNNTGKHIRMDEIVFGRDPVHALTKLLAKVTSAVQAKKKDPFEDDLSDALDKEFPDLKADPFDDDEESAFE